MAEFNVNVDKRDIRKFNRTMSILKKFAKKDFLKAAQDTASNIVFLAKNRVPVDTGALRQSITVGGDKIGGEVFSVFVDAGMDYAGLVEFGTTGPYTVRVKNAKVLTDGKSFFGKQVTIPKRKPQPYFYNSVRDGIKSFNKDINLKLKKISVQ